MIHMAQMEAVIAITGKWKSAMSDKYKVKGNPHACLVSIFIVSRKKIQPYVLSFDTLCLIIGNCNHEGNLSYDSASLSVTHCSL